MLPPFYTQVKGSTENQQVESEIGVLAIFSTADFTSIALRAEKKARVRGVHP
jgi:hypothetical protein